MFLFCSPAFPRLSHCIPADMVLRSTNMKFSAFQLRDKRCPNCDSLSLGTTVFPVPLGNGPSYTFHDCGICGKLVHRIVWYGSVMTTAEASEREKKSVLEAVNIHG